MIEIESHLRLLDVLVVIFPQVVHDEVGDLAIVFVRQPQLLLGRGGVALTFSLSLEKKRHKMIQHFLSNKPPDPA